MKSAGDRREAVLAGIRQALQTYNAPKRRAEVIARLASPPQPLVPERARRQKAEQRTLLRTFLEGQSATFIEVGAPANVPRAIAAYLRSANLPLRVRVGEDAVLDSLPWTTEPALERKRGRAEAEDDVGLSRAVAAIAETGTLVLASGADNPVTLGYLPETHIVIIDDESLVGGFEGAWQKIRAKFGRRIMPRTVNFISGPSRTADIGGELVMGAHGPRRLCVILVRAGS